jgi:putative membrane protein
MTRPCRLRRAVRSRHRHAIEQASRRKILMSTQVEKELYHSVSDLNLLYGGIERLISTPLAPMYMRHYQRGLLAWLFLLPCGLTKAGCSTALKLVCVVASAAYLFLGIDEIGLQIEQPFFVMPVHRLAEGLTRDVVEELSV